MPPCHGGDRRFESGRARQQLLWPHKAIAAKQCYNRTMEYIGASRNNKKVVVDYVGSHAATHLRDTPQLVDLVKEKLAAVDLESDYIYQDYDMGRPIGETDLTETTSDDDVIYAKRVNRDIFTRFVRQRQREKTNWLTIVLKKLDGNTYELDSAWIGRVVPSFPGDPHETLKASRTGINMLWYGEGRKFRREVRPKSALGRFENRQLAPAIGLIFCIRNTSLLILSRSQTRNIIIGVIASKLSEDNTTIWR
jgi:hypothetical protein